MESLSVFSIPISGLKDGTHLFDYQIDTVFFKHFPDAPITDGTFKVHITFEKKPSVIDVLFDFQGFMNTACDRCLEQLQLPINSQNRLLIKFSDDFREEAEVIYLPFDIQEWNIAKYIYEYVCLAIPLIKTHDLTDVICDEKMLSYLNLKEKEESTEEGNPIWDQLKNIKLN